LKYFFCLHGKLKLVSGVKNDLKNIVGILEKG
jgi:hypothetical protein